MAVQLVIMRKGMGCDASQGCHEIAYSQLLIDSSVVSAEAEHKKNESVGQVIL